MRAVVLTGPNQHEIRDDVPVPPPGELEVLCKVDSVAICGTDLHIYEGRFPGRWPKSYPFIPGHEWSGTVVEVGQGADAEYVVQSIRSVFPIPDELELRYGAMVDTASIALHSVKRAGIEPGDA